MSAAPTIGGWERSVLQGAFQAILNDVDYYIYVEQDLLVRGEGWVERCVATLMEGKNKISYGAATEPTTTVGFGAQPLQQSLVIVSRSYLPTFVQRVLENKVKNLQLVKTTGIFFSAVYQHQLSHINLCLHSSKGSK